MTAPRGWHFPQREELFPIAPEQSCIFCGSEEWRYVYLLLKAPQWVQELPWVINWFVAVCSPCHAAYQAGDEALLAARGGGGSPHFTELLAVIKARLSESPVARTG